MRKWYALARIILIFLCLLVMNKVYAKSAKSWVKQLDLVNIDTLEQNDVISFWKSELNADADFKAMLKAIRKKKKSLIESTSTIEDLLNKVKYVRNEISVSNNNDIDELCEALERDLHIDAIRKIPTLWNSNLKIKIGAVEEMNAVAYPDGYIVVYSSLLNQMNYDELLAVCAHEIVHYVFQHSLSNEYAYIKKKKSNNLWATIGGGLLAGAGAFTEGYYSGMAGQQFSGADNYVRMFEGIVEGAEENALKFRFRYSRKDELQSDIIGCRYLQYLGLDANAMLTMLEKLGTEGDKYYSKKNDHPKNKFRIEVIKTLLGKK